MKQRIRQQILLKIRQKFHGIYSWLPQQKVHQLVCLTYIHIISFNSTTLVMTIKILYVEVFVILDQLNSTLLKKLVCLIGFSSLTLTALNYLVLNLFVFSPVTQVPQLTIQQQIHVCVIQSFKTLLLISLYFHALQTAI